ncbi:hypothetical protein CVCC1112_1700 [Paenarthrobacter nicotinovorans]|nr:hypothetical protein CVCC1112_1700 [Paenarthrobacter nicotinovorans]
MGFCRVPESDTKHRVGVTGFEPATSCSQSRRSSQAELHPERTGQSTGKRAGNAHLTPPPELGLVVPGFNSHREVVLKQDIPPGDVA